jgi:hypothetical protein
MVKNIIDIIKEEYKKLGGGGFGKVYSKGGYAYKVTTDKDEARFSIKIKNNMERVSSFPIIYDVILSSSKNYYIIKREEVSLLKPTDKAYVNNNTYKMMRYVNTGSEDHLAKLKETKLNDKFLNFLINLRKDYKLLGKKEEDIDIHGDNIGINKNGDYVLFDY